MTDRPFTIGFIVNPIAGIGGPAGLKGSDGEQIVQQALAEGFQASAPKQANRFIKKLSQFVDKSITINVLTCQGAMGENALKDSGLAYELVYYPATPTHSQDTHKAYLAICQQDVDIIIFVGGDGTARDILDCQDGKKRLHLGIAGGVKIQSSVFARSPAVAAQIVIATVKGRCEGLYREVLDINESALRKNIVSAKHYGDLLVPNDAQHLQGAKSHRQISEQNKIATLARYAYQTAPDKDYIIIGPGSTTMALKEKMGGGTLLGVDVYYHKKLLKKDVNQVFLNDISHHDWQLYLTCTGGQGFLLGRGNQQIGSMILQQINQQNITILASVDKIVELQGHPMRIDCGDDLLEQSISGYYPVLVGDKQSVVYQVSN